jgi:hypothetical protein
VSSNDNWNLNDHEALHKECEHTHSHERQIAEETFQNIVLSKLVSSAVVLVEYLQENK